MKATLKSTLGTICGAIAIVAVYAAVCVKDGSEHEMAFRVGGAIGFAVFALAWAKLKGE